MLSFKIAMRVQNGRTECVVWMAQDVTVEPPYTEIYTEVVVATLRDVRHLCQDLRTLNNSLALLVGVMPCNADVFGIYRQKAAT